MRYRMFVVVASAVMLLPGVLAAKDEETRYFAWKPETGDLVAYTAAGVVNTILDGGVEWSFTGWRLDARTVVALIVSAIDREVSVYRVTPESAQPLAFLFDADDLHSPTNRPEWLAAYSFPYMVFAIGYQPPFEGLLIKVDTGTVETLENLIIGSLCCRFSEDGLYLRYMTVEETIEGIELTLRERTLETSEERVAHTLEVNDINAYLRFEPDFHGNRWLYDQFSDDGENTTHTVIMLFPDGTSEVVTEEEYYYLRDRHEWYFLEDHLVVLSNSLCERDCFLQMYPSGEDTPIEFVLPPLGDDGTMNTISLLPQIAEGSLLVSQYSSGYWQLKPDQNAVFIGKSSNYTMGEISHTGRWLLVADDEYEPHEYRVWDNLNEQYVLTDEEFVVDDTPVEMIYNDESVLVQSLHTGAGKLYHSADDTIFEISGEPLAYFEILADGTLLFQQSSDRDDRPSGIYLYDPTSESYTLLVQGASHFWLEPVFFF